tara:strand:- start:410 stop:586 length:177 start_codon:yes stop_codon:yes gene_type:complete
VFKLIQSLLVVEVREALPEMPMVQTVFFLVLLLLAEVREVFLMTLPETTVALVVEVRE